MFKDRSDTPGVILPPPIIYMAFLLFGIAIHRLFPLNLTLTETIKFASTLSILLSLTFVFWSFITMRRLGTSVNPYEATQVIATEGPFRYSRNPIYTATIGLYIGISLLLGTLWPIALLPLLLWIMNWGVISREEKYLEAKFGASYLAYKSKVRRWL